MQELTESQINQRLHWKYRAVEATTGQKTQLGCILLAVLETPLKNPPRFGQKALINEEGIVWARFEDRHRVVHDAIPVCTVRDLVDNFSRLADHLKMGDAEAHEMFAMIRRWIVKDLRVDPNLQFTQWKDQKI